MAFFEKFLDIEVEETRRFRLLFLIFLVFSIGIAWADSSTRSVVGVASIHYNFLAQAHIYFGIALIPIFVAYSALFGHFTNQRLLLGMSIIAFLTVGATIWAVFSGYRLAGSIALYVLAELILVAWVTQWRITQLEYYDTRAAKRIVPLFGFAQFLGLSIGGFSYPILSNLLGLSVESIYILWFLCLLIISILLFIMPRFLQTVNLKKDDPDPGLWDTLRDGFTFIRQSRYLQWMSLNSVLMNSLIAFFLIISTGLVAQEYLRLNAGSLTDTALRLSAENQTAVFFSLVRAVASLLMLGLQFVILPPILRNLRLGTVNLIYPFSTLGVAIWLALVTLNPATMGAVLIVSAFAQVSVKSYRRALQHPVNSLLTNAVPSYTKNDSRTVMNGILSPLAHIVVGLIFVFVTQIEVLVFVGVLIAIAYLATAFVLRRAYGKEMLKLLEAEDYTALLKRDYELDTADAETVQQLMARMAGSDDREFQRFIVTILLEVGGTETIAALIEYAKKANTAVRRTILQELASVGVTNELVRQFYTANTHDADPLVRRAALAGLMGILDKNATLRSDIASDHLHDKDPQVRAAMLKVLMQSSVASHRDKAERTLKAMLSDYVPEVRIAAIHALVDLGDPEAIRRLVVFMEDDDDTVRLAATIGIETLMDKDVSKELITVILERQNLLLDDTVERIRQSELMILGKIGNKQAAEVILRALVDNSPVIRETAITAFKELGKVGVTALKEASNSLKPLLSQNAMITLTQLGYEEFTEPLLALVREYLQEIYQHHSMTYGLSVCSNYPSFVVLKIYFQERNQQIIDNVFQILETIYDRDAILTIYDTLQSSQIETRLNAVEALETLVPSDITRQIANLYDPEVNEKTISEMYYASQGYEGDTTEQVMMRLATSENDWVRAVSIMALGEIAADNNNIRRIILENDSIAPVDNANLSACQKAVSPELVSVTIKGALASKNPNVQHTAEAALRLIRGESILSAHERQTNKESVSVISTIERMIYLKRIPFFQKLSVEQLKALANISIEEVFKQGSLIFREGDRGGSLYMVVTGRVEVGLMNRERNTFTMLAQYEGNTEFGEMSLFDGQPRSADAIAKEDTVVLTLHREPFLALTRQYPDLAIHMITTLSDRLRRANEQIARLNNTMPQTLDV